MKFKKLPSQKELLELLDYNQETGKLFWKSDEEAFTAIDKKVGYKRGLFKGERYQAHRIIFKMVYGYDPDQIDHDDKDKLNNRISNLIDAGAIINSQNMKRYSSNKSGVTGVSWYKREKRWVARITVNKKTKILIYTTDFNKAVLVRKQAKKDYGFNPNHGADV